MSWQTRRAELLLAGLNAALMALALHLTGAATREDHVTLFATGSFAGSLIAATLPERLAWRAGRAGAAGVAWLFLYMLFVAYKSAPPLGVTDCDGPCGGWYTFEFDPPYWVLIVVPLAGALLGRLATGVWRIARGRLIRRSSRRL